MNRKSAPCLFLRPRSRTFERDYEFARLVYGGTVPRDAAEAVGMKPGAAFTMLCRLRQRALRWAGREVSDAMIFRLMFDRERAEADFKQIGNEDYNGDVSEGVKPETVQK